MKKLLLLATILTCFSGFAEDGEDQLDVILDYGTVSREFVMTIEPIDEDNNLDKPLMAVYDCVYTDTVSSVFLDRVSSIMRNILNRVSEDSTAGEFVFSLIAEDDPEFFDNLLANDSNVVETCEAEIDLAHSQDYITDLVLKKTIALATAGGIQAGSAMTE